MNSKKISKSKKWKKDKKKRMNKIVVSAFLLLVLATIISRFIISITYDLGVVNGSYHIGFWEHPEKAFAAEFNIWLAKNPGKTWGQFLNANILIRTIIREHPNYLWTMTQFTWLTTYILVVVLIFRLFKFENRIPKGFKWLVSQTTLAGITMFEMLVGVGYWGFVFTSLYDGNASSNLSLHEVINTTVVHLVIPFLLLIYSTIFLVYDKNASLLRESFAVRMLIWPTIYFIYYLIVTILWNDPYPLTNFHNKLVNDYSTENNGNWYSWATEIWKPALMMVIFYSFSGTMAVIHNLILVNLNKSYCPEKDYQFMMRYENAIKKLKRQLVKRATDKKTANQLIEKMHLR